MVELIKDPVIELVKKRANISKDLALLFISRVLMRVSLGALGVFLPIYFYEQFGYQVLPVIMIFVAIYSLHLLLAPIFARLFHIWGMRKMMILGIGMATLSFITLYLFPKSPEIGIVAYIFTVSLYRASYWVPYQVDLARELDESRRGRQLALMANISDLLSVAVPFLGGVAIALAQFENVFLFASFLMLLAILPLLFVSDVYEYYSWSYLETFKKLFSSENRPLFIAQAANGAQGVVTLFFWPLYLYFISQGDYAKLGFITSLTILAIMIIRHFTGKWIDKMSARNALFAGVALSASGWLLKLFVHTPVQAVAVDTYHRVGRTVNGLSFSAVTYEQSADSGSFIDEYTTLREMAQNIGRVFMLILVAALIAYLSVNIRVAFLIAALVTLFMIFLDKFQKLS